MPWLDLLRDPRTLAALAQAVIGIVFLVSSPARGTRHARWIAGSTIAFGASQLFTALETWYLGTPSAASVIVTSYVSAVVIMALATGLDAYRDPSLPNRRRIVWMLGVVPLGLLGFNLVARLALAAPALALAMFTALLTCVPAWKAWQIYRADRWGGHLMLLAALALVPATLLLAAWLRLGINEYRMLVVYPATLALISAFALLNLRDSMERQQQMRELSKARAELQALADSLERKVLARTERLEAVIDGLKSFNALVSHDLRAPLRNARGLVDVATEAIRLGDSNDALTALEVIRKEAHRGAAMVDDLLRLASVEEAELRLCATDMHGVLHAAAQTLQRDHPRALEVIDIGPMPTLELDPGLMQHVAINLLGNALKYGRPVAALKIEVVAERQANGFWRFEVRDNGPGFAAEHAARIFDPFMRVPGTREAGTGVGLTLVARVVRRHHGEVGARGQPGQGAAFWWTLPERQLSPG